MPRNPTPPALHPVPGPTPVERPRRVRRRASRGEPPPLVQIPVWGPPEAPAEDEPAPAGTDALLDANGDGVVVSSLHARALTRVYGKAVTGGKSEAALSEEESQALREALASAPGPARTG